MPTVLAQRWRGPLQLLVVDDASSDATPDVLEELAARHGHLQVVRREVAEGRAAAWRAILDEVTTPLIAFAEVGAVWHPRKLELQLAASDATAGDEVLVTAAWRRPRTDPPGDVVVAPPTGPDAFARLARGDAEVAVGSLFGPTDLVRAAGGFDPQLRHLAVEGLLLGWLAGRGRLVAPSLPLGAGPLAADPPIRELAADLDRLLATHRAALRAHDLDRDVERRRLTAAARAHAAAGERLRAKAVRARLRLLGGPTGAPPTEDGDGVAPRPTRGAKGPPEPAPTTPLERAVRLSDAGDHAGAEDVLRTELEARPDDAVVLVRLSEVLVLRESWREALDTWARADVPLDADPVTGTTAGLLARAHRALGDHRAALALAESGLRTWPEVEVLHQELGKSRAATTDWATAIRIEDRPDATTAVADGAVTDLGFLRDGDGAIAGWVAGGEVGAPEVAFEVGDLVVATTHAAYAEGPEVDAARPFAIRCQQVLEFLGDGDVLTVTRGGAPLPLPGGGTRAVVHTGYPSRLDELRDRLDAGRVFTKFGRLRAGHTPARKRRTIALYREVAEVVEDLVGHRCTPFYGNLLGAVRDQDFITHDVGGFDVGYVSDQRSSEAVRAELRELCARLLDAGFHLTLEPWSVMVRRTPTGRVFIDLNFGWFTPDDRLQLSYGWRYPPVTDPSAYRAPRHALLAGESVPVPGNAEAVLEQCYGPNWPIPDQGFDPAYRLQRDLDFLLTEDDLDAIAALRPDQARIVSVLGPDGEVVSRLDP